eukprot:6197834-Pleurochrysis_carterae.AAC.1
MQATTGSAALTLPNGTKLPSSTSACWSFRRPAPAWSPHQPSSLMAIAKFTNRARMTAELLHARFNDRRAEVLRLLPQCTRDAPDEWA